MDKEGGSAQYVELDIEPISLSLAKQWLPFVQYLREALPFHVTERALGRIGVFDRQYPHFESEDSSVSLVLTLEPENDQSAAYVTRSDEGVDDKQDEVDVWRKAVSRAMARLSEEEEERPWWSIIGQANDSVGGAVLLDFDDLRAREFQLLNLKQPYSEHIENWSSPSLNGYSMKTSYPIILLGSLRAYNWEIGLHRAAVKSNQVAAVLSVATDTAWRLRSAPRPDADSGNKTYPEWAPGAGSPGDVHLMPTPRALPGNFEELLEGAETKSLVERTVRSHWHGLLMEPRSPSYSLVCYVGVIETIGKQLLDTNSTDRQRFLACIRTLYPGVDQTEEVFDQVYSRYRSRTVHGGWLHGGEESMGSFYTSGSGFEPLSSDLTFRFNILRIVRDASRRAIESRIV